MKRQVQRDAVSNCALLRRLRDSELTKLNDPRDARGRRHSYRSVVSMLMLGMCAASRSLRALELLSANLCPGWRRRTRVRGRISDNTRRAVLRSLSADDVRGCLHQQVLAEKRRGNLEPHCLPMGVLVIDGKSLGTVSTWEHDGVQKIDSADGPYGLTRVHRATLVSSKAVVTVDQRTIPGNTNEIGALPDFLAELFDRYRRSNMFETITADAGNCPKVVARQIDAAGYGYFLRIKGNRGEVLREAHRQLEGSEPEFEQTRRERSGKVICRVYRTSLEGGWIEWESVRQFFRVDRTVRKDDGTETTGHRYYITNLHRGRFPRMDHWLRLVKSYWRCENEQHWTADVVFHEDARRTPWTTTAETVYVLGILRCIALNILAVLRAACRSESTGAPVQWDEVFRRVSSMLRAPPPRWGVAAFV